MHIPQLVRDNKHSIKSNVQTLKQKKVMSIYHVYNLEGYPVGRRDLRL